MLQLLSATPSPYARKVRIALAEKKIPFELITEVPWDSTTTTPVHNPLEKLPVLILNSASDEEVNGRTNGGHTAGVGKQLGAVYESHYILEYLEAKHPRPRLLPSAESVDARLFARKVEVVADGVCDALVLRFFEKHRAAESQSKEWTARQMRKVDGGLRALDEWAEQARARGDEFLVENQFGLADIAAATVCGYVNVRFKEYGLKDKYPTLAAFADRMEQRESFKNTVPSPQTITDKVV